MSSPARVEIPGRSFPLAIEPGSVTLTKRLSESPKLAGVIQLRVWKYGRPQETASSGIPQVDALTGGFPRGCLTEVCGSDSSGRTTLLLSALGAATRREEICTLIDVSDAFDPRSATAAGVTWNGYFGSAAGRILRLLLIPASTGKRKIGKSGNSGEGKILSNKLCGPLTCFAK